MNPSHQNIFMRVSIQINEFSLSFLCNIFAGGHNLLILARDLGNYLQLGTTIDDAIGEAYDKIAKWLGLDLSRSGGPAIEKLSQEGDNKSVKFAVILVCTFANQYYITLLPFRLSVTVKPYSFFATQNYGCSSLILLCL